MNSPTPSRRSPCWRPRAATPRPRTPAWKPLLATERAAEAIRACGRTSPPTGRRQSELEEEIAAAEQAQAADGFRHRPDANPPSLKSRNRRETLELALDKLRAGHATLADADRGPGRHRGRPGTRRRGTDQAGTGRSPHRGGPAATGAGASGSRFRIRSTQRGPCCSRQPDAGRPRSRHPSRTGRGRPDRGTVRRRGTGPGGRRAGGRGPRRRPVPWNSSGRSGRGGPHSPGRRAGGRPRGKVRADPGTHCRRAMRSSPPPAGNRGNGRHC